MSAHRSPRKRNIVVACSTAAGVVLLLTAFVVREDVRWWWRMRSVTRVVVVDPVLETHVLEGGPALRRAEKATREFIESLPREPESDVTIVGYVAEVVFARPPDPGSPALGNAVFSVWLNHWVDDERVMIYCMGTMYPSTASAWFAYLREVLRPRTNDLVAEWRGPAGKRFGSAAALALLAPATEGVADFLLRRALDEKHRASFWFLGAMGPSAAGAIPDLERALADPRTESQMRVDAETALKWIRRSGGPIFAQPP